MREIQVVNVWEAHRPNDSRLGVAIDTARTCTAEVIRLVMEFHVVGVLPQATLLTETLVEVAMSTSFG